MPGEGLTIDEAKRSITIHGNDSERPFYVQSGASLTLLNLAIDHGNTDIGDGGGLLNDGVLVVDDYTFSYNQAEQSGGALANSGTVTITNSTFQFNAVDYFQAEESITQMMRERQCLAAFSWGIGQS